MKECYFVQLKKFVNFPATVKFLKHLKFSLGLLLLSHHVLHHPLLRLHFLFVSYDQHHRQNL